MKSAYSPSWKSSTQPRKQRKYAANLPDHLKGKILTVHLSKELRAKHGFRTIRARVGDKVRVLRGTHKGKEGRIERVDVKNGRFLVAKVERVKLDGGRAPYPLQPSNLMITDLAGDKRRFKREQASAKPKAQKQAPAKKPVQESKQNQESKQE